MLKSWSFSSLTQYEKCPYSIKLKVIDRLPEPEPAPNSPLLRGTKFHENIEQWIKGTGDLLPELINWTPKLQVLSKNWQTGHLICEDEWGFTRDWQPTAWQDATCRMKLDAGIIALPEIHVIDFKTGKAAGNEVKHTLQGQLYAVGAKQLYPEATTIKVEFWYLDFPSAKPLSAIYTPQKIEKFKESYNRRSNKMLSDTEFTPMPSKGNCRFCAFNEQCPYAILPT